MFREDYVKDNEQIVPEEATKKYIRAKLSAVETKAKPGVKYLQLIAAALCLVLAVGIMFVPSNKGKTKPQYIGESTLMNNVTYEDIYKKIKDCINKSEENF